MIDAIEAAQRAIQTPAVQAMMAQLAEYGLGVNIPHAHRDDRLVPLDSGLVATEKDLRVSFEPTAKVSGSPDIIDVGWRWNKETKMVELVQCCNQCSGAN